MKRSILQLNGRKFIVMSNSLKKIRVQKGISQNDCAENIGVSLRTLQRYENGEIIGEDFIKKLAVFLDVSVDELLSSDDEC